MDYYKSVLDYFKNDFLKTDVFISKYALENELPEQMFERLAKELYRIESTYENALSYERILELLKDFKYLILGGSNLFGIGNNKTFVSLSNCFYINNYSDSYAGILKLDEEMAQAMKRRGGVGIDISHLRPKGFKVNNAAKTSSGAVSFMNRFSNTTREVAQDGRRGALMITMHVTHPDISDFIKSKQDLTKITGANISIKVTDEFMRAVIDDDGFVLTFPTLEEPIIVEARKIWEEFIDSTYNTAEPGLLFWDTIERKSPSNLYTDFEVKGVNPCFSGKELLLTTNGNITFEELAKVGKAYIYNKDGDIVESKIWCSGNKKVVTIVNSLKETTICTPDHIWLTTKNIEVKAKDLKGHSIMPYLNNKLEHDKLYLKLGFIQGDGNLSRLDNIKFPTHNGFEINIGENDNDILELFGYSKNDFRYTYYTNEFYSVCNDLGFSKEILPHRTLPTTFEVWENKLKLAFLSGLFSANGTVIDGTRIAFKTTSKALVNELQLALEEQNIHSYITTNKAVPVKFNNGEYIVKESYDLNISKYNDVYRFYTNIRFIHNYKNEKLIKLLLIKSPKITKVIDNNEIIPVYDFNEPITNWGVVNNKIAHNCAEIVLSDYECCRLASINLTSYVDEPFTEKARFNFSKFATDVHDSQRLMDDIVDLDIEKMLLILDKIMSDEDANVDIIKTEYNLWSKILKKTIEGRRTGLGITGYGDTLAMLNLPYALKYPHRDVVTPVEEITNDIFRTFAINSYASSITLAKERGSFKDCNPELERRSEALIDIFAHMFPNKRMEWLKYGRRNIAINTIAPNGSISILAGVTSGIEPAYQIGYNRRRKIDDKNVKGYFTDSVGDKWVNYVVLHDKFVEWCENEKMNIDYLKQNTILLNNAIRSSPYYKSTALDIVPLDKLKLQAVIQRWIDHSISVTHNLPNDVTKEEVSKIYIESWKMGNKGCTIYREGSREGVLTSLDTSEKVTKKQFNQYDAIKRPKELYTELYKVKINKEDYVVAVGLFENKPIEIFLIPFSGVVPISAINRKMERGSYNIIKLNGEVLFKNITKNSFEYGTITRLISLALRHGTKVDFLVEQLNKDNNNFNSAFRAISKVLKYYIKENDKVSGITCPQCGQESLIYAEGCHKCISCGYNGCQ